MTCWHDRSKNSRFKEAARWFKDFREFKGQAILRIARSTGKVHLYVKVGEGEVAVTWKKGDKFLTHYPAYSSREKRLFHTASEALSYIRDLRCQ